MGTFIDLGNKSNDMYVFCNYAVAIIKELQKTLLN